MTTKTPSRLTPGQAAREAFNRTFHCNDTNPDGWDAIAAAAIEASPELKNLKAEKRDLEKAVRIWAVNNRDRVAERDEARAENERLRQRVTELEAGAEELTLGKDLWQRLAERRTTVIADLVVASLAFAKHAADAVDTDVMYNGFGEELEIFRAKVRKAQHQ